MTLHQGTGGLRFSCQKRLSQWALAVDADRGQEATAANISCSSGEQFKEFSLPRSACSVLYYSWGGGGGAGEKRVACCTIENARFTCLLLPLWLAFSCGGNCIGTHAVEWGWRVYLSPAFAVSCCKSCISLLSVMRRFWPARQRCPHSQRLYKEGCSRQVCGHGVAQAIEWLGMES